MVNGVLVEKTVKDVTPALQTNSEGLKKVLEELVKQYKRQQDDMEKWKVGSLSFESIATFTMGIPCSSRTSYGAAKSGPIIWTFADGYSSDAEEK